MGKFVSKDNLSYFGEKVKGLLDGKVDKVSGKGLSTNDYTTEEKNKLSGIAAGAEVNVQSDWNATSGDAFIKNKPTIPTVNNGTLTIQKNGTNVATFTANQSGNSTANLIIPTSASDVSALPDTTKYGASLSLTMNTTTYVLTAQLKDQSGNNLGTAQTIDLPLESVVVSGSYDKSTKKVVLTLKDGSTVDFSVADLVSGLVPNTRKVNGKALSSDITLTASDVGALPSSTTIPSLDGVVKKTGDETISGYKQFEDAMYIKGGTSAPTMTNLGAYIYADGNRTHLNLRGVFGSDINFDDDALSLAYSSLVNTFDINSKTKDGFKVQINSKEVATKDMIPTVNNATLTIQKNGTNVATFTANASSNATANITVPTALSEMTQSASYRTVTDTEKSTWNAKSNFSGSYTDLTNKPTIPTNTNQLTNGAGFVTSSGSVANATKLNNQEASYYLNYNNLSNKPTIPSLASVLLWQNASPSSEMGETTITLSKSLVVGKNYAIYYKYQNTAVSKIKLEFKYGGTGYIGWLNMYDTSSSGNYLKNRLVEITASNKIKFYKNYTNANVYAASLIPTEIYELPN